VVTELQHEEILGSIGLDKTRKDMIVLGALLKAQQDPTQFITFEELREQLALDEGSRRGKDPLIYRSLSWLEKEGFIRIDSSRHKHGYSTSIATIERALDGLVAKKIQELEKELKQTDSEVTQLSEINSDITSSSLINLLAGKRRIEKPVFAQGNENILKLLDDKVYRGLKKGDVVRITLEWLAQSDYMNVRRIINAESLIKKGVEFRALDYNRGGKKIREKSREIIAESQKRGNNVGYRIFPRKDATYQFVARNREGIMLIVSEDPLSATWLPRSSNPELVDNAIESFDIDFKQGTNLADFKE